MNIVLQIKIENNQIVKVPEKTSKRRLKQAKPDFATFKNSSTLHLKIYNMEDQHNGTESLKHNLDDIEESGSQCITCDDFNPNSYK